MSTARNLRDYASLIQVTRFVLINGNLSDKFGHMIFLTSFMTKCASLGRRRLY